MKTDSAATGLTFTWPHGEGFSFLLTGCMAVSLMAHAATFFLFQVAEPLGTTIAHSAPQVSVLTPSSPEAMALLHWIGAQDPALVAAASSVTPAGLPDIPYRPSYATMRTAPLGPVETPVAVPFPAAHDALAVLAGVDARPAPAPGPGAALPTTAGVSENLGGRVVAPLPPFVPKARAAEPVEPTRHLLGVTAGGAVRFVFLQSSSGHSALDEEAAAYWQKLGFPPGDAPITWTTATVTWGDDAYTRSPNSDLRSPK